MGLGKATALPVGALGVDISAKFLPGYFGARAEVAAHIKKDLWGYASGDVGYDIGIGRKSYAAVIGLRGRF